MPRMDGREALGEIKRAPEWRAVPVVVLTNSRSPEDIEAAYDRGANSYIAKPHSVDELAAILRIVWEFWFRVAVLPGAARSP
jgi:CheY-like chemotaxis protein